MPDIEPEKLYAFTDAKKLIPGPRGRHVCLRTLHRWRIKQRLTAIRLDGGFWFVRGSELLRLLEGEPSGPPIVRERTAAQEARDVKWAELELERFFPGKILSESKLAGSNI